MQTVEQWLTAHGVAVNLGLGVKTNQATATNLDGSVVVGILNNNQAFLARVTSTGSGIIDTADFNRTLQASAFAHLLASQQTDMVMYGLHGNLMRGLVKAGQQSSWVSGDIGRQDHANENGDIASGEVGDAYGVTDNLTLKLAIGRTYTSNTALYDSKTTLRGTYVMPEVIYAIPETALQASASLYYNTGDANISRGYLNAGTLVQSFGRPDADMVALRLRLDWLDAFKFNAISLTPYTSVTLSRSHIAAYTETGGGFPVQWDSRTEYSLQGRLGLDGIYAVKSSINLLAHLEAAHRFEQHSSGVEGQILGLNRFNIEGNNYRQDWLSAGIGLDGNLGKGVASIMLNATTESQAPSSWLYASYRLTF